MSEATSTFQNSLPSRSLMAWLRLMRLPTVFTAMGNVLCGFFVSSEERNPAVLASQPELWLLLLASVGLYLGGMVLNDVFDADLDAEERPGRPIPSGQIGRQQAARLGWFLVAVGILSAWGAGFVSKTGHTSLLIAAFLSAAVVLYNAVLKSTPAGPFGMATCRFLNVMLGASCCGPWESVWGGPQLSIAVALFVYIVGVTWFARNEAGQSQKSALLGALAVVLAGLGINAWMAFRTYRPDSPATGALIALGLIAANIALRCLRAIDVNQPILLQKTVGFMLLNIIFVDATMTFCVTGSGRIAAVVVILVVPATLMKRVIPMS